MRLSQRALSNYRNEVNAQAELASAYVRKSLDEYFRQNPNASTADGRRFAIELLKAALPNFTVAAETLAADFFDEVMEVERVAVDSQLYDTTDYSVIEDKVRYFARKLNGKDEEAFKREVVDATHYFVKRSAYENLVRNCDANKVRYARVPSGFETCAFCFMLASRGFVYHSEATARGLHGYHNHCDCCIVPGVKGRTRIEGYDPKGMHDRWRECAETARLDPNTFDVEARRAIMREVEMRDFHWLYTGEVPKVSYTSKKAEIETLEKRPHEAKTAEALSKIGFKCVLGGDSKKTGTDNKGRTLFDGYADNPTGIEFKTVLTSKNAYGAVKNYFENSLKKKNLKRMVIDNTQSKYLSDSEIEKAIAELSKLERYRGVSKWVSLLRKEDNQLIDVIRR